MYLAHIVTKIISHYLVSTVLAAGVRCAAHLEPVFSLDLSNNKRLKNVTTPSILSRSSPLLISSQWGQINRSCSGSESGSGSQISPHTSGLPLPPTSCIYLWNCLLCQLPSHNGSGTPSGSCRQTFLAYIAAPGWSHHLSSISLHFTDSSNNSTSPPLSIP